MLSEVKHQSTFYPCVDLFQGINFVLTLEYITVADVWVKRASVVHCLFIFYLILAPDLI